jgi:alpha-L-fucosidase
MTEKQYILRTLRPVLLFLVVLTAACTESVSDDMLERSRQTPAWFDDGKLGIFIHWGPASVPAFAAGEPLRPGALEDILMEDSPRRELPYAEWYLNSLNYAGSSTARHHAEVYGDAPYTDFQTPFEERVDEGWNPAAWAELFEKSGASYVVLVTKHHDGYTLWPSDVENPNRDNWGSQRDLVGELASAVRARGMRFGTYYSTGLDWSFKLVTDDDWVRAVMRSAPASEAYADYTYQHMVELIDRYHPDVLWADIGYPSQGRQDELFSYYFSEVPEGVVNDRWGGVDVLGQIAAIPGATWVLKKLARWSIENKPDPLIDDPARPGFKTAEYDSLPGIAPFKWEATRGLGGSFAFNAQETSADMLTAEELVTYVVDTVSKNGNVLINVGPDSYGRIPENQQAPLLGLGQWIEINGEALYGTHPWQRFNNQEGRDLRYTQGDGALYAIVTGEVGESFTIEDPGVSYLQISVLGATVKHTGVIDGLLTVTLDKPLSGAAAVVRYTLP